MHGTRVHVCLGTPRLLTMGTAQTPGRAAAVYNDIKVAKYGDQSNFVPFIVETGGRINATGLEFFDTVSGALEGDTTKVREFGDDGWRCWLLQ